MNQVLNDAYIDYEKGLLTFPEYKEIETELYRLQHGKTIKTCKKAVKDFFNHYTVTIKETHTGWTIKAF